MAKFGAALDNLTIEIGQDLMPALQKVMGGLLDIGSWFGRNKNALYAVLGGAGALYAGAAVVKTVSVIAKVVGGVKTVFGAVTGTGSLTAAGTTLTAAGTNLNLAAGKLMGTGGAGVPGVVGAGGAEGEGIWGIPLVAGTTTAASLAAVAAGMYGVYRVANWLSSELTGFGRLPFVANKPAPKVAGATATRFNLATQLTAQGKSLPLWLRNELGPADLGTITAYARMPKGAVLPGTHGTGKKYTKTWAPATALATADWSRYVAGLSPTAAKSAWSSLSSRSPAQQASALNSGKAEFNSAAQLVAAGVKQLDASDHMKMSAAQITAAAKQEATTLEKLITAATGQTNAATTTQTSANELSAAAKTLASAAVDLVNGAATMKSTLSPQNLHNTATQGLKQVVARK
jgi:hypothetical protein